MARVSEWVSVGNGGRRKEDKNEGWAEIRLKAKTTTTRVHSPIDQGGSLCPSPSVVCVHTLSWGVQSDPSGWL